MDIINTKENIINENIDSAIEALLKIRSAVQHSKTLKISEVKDGEHFTYNGVEFIRLGREQSGVLCIEKRPFVNSAFSDNDNKDCNNWAGTSVREMLHSEFLPLLDGLDLISFESDLIADNGDTAYDRCIGKVSLLSCDLYRKYRMFIPHFDIGMWTCTPWCCDGETPFVRFVGTEGTIDADAASNIHSFVPVFIIRDDNKENTY